MVSEVQVSKMICCNGMTNLCISDADVLIPRHNNKTTPVIATHSKNLVLVIKLHIALVGGS